MSWLFSQALAEEYLVAISSAGEPCAQLSVMPTALPFWCNGKPMDACRFSPIWSDVTAFDGRPWRGLVEVVSGGFPCQDISIAGTGDGLDGERSGLWREMARIVRAVGPRFVYVENRSSHFSGASPSSRRLGQPPVRCRTGSARCVRRWSAPHPQANLDSGPRQ